MITRNPYHLYHGGTKPGHGEPEPIRPPQTYDSQENIDRCLNCKVQGGCDTRSSMCALSEWNRKRSELDGRVRDMLLAGHGPKKIMRALGISEYAFYKAKERIRSAP